MPVFVLHFKNNFFNIVVKILEYALAISEINTF